MHLFLQTIGHWMLLVACLTFATATSAAEPALELVVQAALVDPTTSLALSPDGQRAVMVSVNGNVILWETASGQLLRAFAVPEEINASGPTRVACSENCERILVQYTLRQVFLWDGHTGQRLRTFPCDESQPIALSRDGRLVVTELDGAMILHDADSGKRRQTFPKSEGTRTAVAISADGRRVLEGLSTNQGKGGSAALWDAATGSKLTTFPASNEVCQAVALSGDGLTGLTATSSKVLIWNLKTGGKARTLEGTLSSLQSVMLSNDGRRILTVEGPRFVSDRNDPESRTAKLWDAESGRLLHTHSRLGGWMVSSCLSGDGRRMLTISHGGKETAVWDTETNSKLQTLQSRVIPQDAAVISGDGTRLMSSGIDSVAALWNATLGQRERTMTGSVSGLSHDGGRTAVKSSLDFVTVFETATNRKLTTLGEANQELKKVVMSSDAKRILTNRERVDRNAGPGTLLTSEYTAVVWDATTGTKLWQFAGEGALSDDGRHLLVLPKYNSPTLMLIDTTTGKTVQTFRNNDPLGLFEFVISGDGRRVLTISYRNAMPEDISVTLWDATTGRPITAYKLAKQARSYRCSLNGDGSRFLVRHHRGETVWDSATGRLLSTLPEWTSGAVFSRDGRLLISPGWDGSTWIFDASTGKALCRLFSIDGGKDWLVVTPDGLFDGSIDAAKSISYRLRGSLEFVALERFQHQYYQPGLLAMLMKGERPRAKVDIGKSLPPKVRIVSPSGSELDVQSGTISVQATAETRGEHPITMFRLLLDGRPYQGQNSLVRIADPKPGKASVTWRVELEPGRHKLKVLADTAYVQGTSDELEVKHIGGQSNADIELPSLYVLAIGVSKYPGTRKLDYAALDATAIAGAYQQHSRSLFKNVEVKVITDEQATRNGIFEGTRWLREKMNQKSVGVFFFAGHGEKDPDGSLYFLPVDFEEKNLAGSALDADVVKKQLSGIPGRLTLILDACHSGQIGSGLTRGVGSLTDQLVRDLTAEENGIIVMCSALGTEPAQESHQHRHGVFTVAMLEGLAGQAKKTNDGAVYLTSLDAYITERVRDLTKGQQHPVTSRPTTVRDFPVSKP